MKGEFSFLNPFLILFILSVFFWLRLAALGCSAPFKKGTKRLVYTEICVIFHTCEHSLFDIKRSRRETSCPSPQEKPQACDGI